MTATQGITDKSPFHYRFTFIIGRNSFFEVLEVFLIMEVIEPTEPLDNTYGFGIPPDLWRQHDKDPYPAEIQTFASSMMAFMLNKFPSKAWRLTPTYLVVTKGEGRRYCFKDFNGVKVKTDGNEWKAGIVVYEGRESPCSHYKHPKTGKHYFTWELGKADVMMCPPIELQKTCPFAPNT